MIKKIITLFISLIYIPVFAQQFTIAVIPDSQNYTDYRYQTFYDSRFSFNFFNVYENQIKFIANQTRDEISPVIFAIHLGDNVLHQKKYEIEWILADYSISNLDNLIPFGMIPGNHDYDVKKKIKSKGTSYYSFYGDKAFKKYFGSNSKHFNNKEWYIDSYNGGMNSAIIITYQTIRILFIGLEMEAGDDCLDWAKTVIDSYPNIPTIVATHEYLNINADPNDGKAKYSSANYRRDFNNNVPLEIWNKFIKKNNQIFMVLCGHSYKNNMAENSRIDLNDEGFPVYQLLSDYEGRTELFEKKSIKESLRYGGDGWLRLLNFNLDKKQIYVQTYSPFLDEYETDTDSDFIIDLDWEERFQK